MKRVDVFALAILGVLAAGLAVTARSNADDRKARTASTNNLKQIGLGFHTYNSDISKLPFNGGARRRRCAQESQLRLAQPEHREQRHLGDADPALHGAEPALQQCGHRGCGPAGTAEVSGR